MPPETSEGLWQAGERVLLALWVGGMWATGFVAAPVLFSALADRMLAGNIAGRLFEIVGLVGIICAGLLLLLSFRRHGRAGLGQWRVWVLGAMLAVTLLGQFVLAPRMQEIKRAAAGALVPGTDLHRRFALLHGISSTLFLANSLLGVLLVAAPGAPRGRD